jgi:hypothetical protein
MGKLLVAAVITVIMLLPTQAVPLDSKAITVDISLVVVSTNPLVLEGTTNLPDGMQLFALLFGYRHLECDGRQQCLDIVNQAGQGTTVAHGHFRLNLEPAENAPPTAWQLFMADSGAQPANVVAAIGEAGEHLLGLYTKRDFIPDAKNAGGGYMVVGVDFNKVICAPPNGKGFIDPRWTPEAEKILGACRRPSP